MAHILRTGGLFYKIARAVDIAISAKSSDVHGVRGVATPATDIAAEQAGVGCL